MPHELTAAEVASIEEEIKHRQTVVTPQCIAEVQRTRAFGDLSENFVNMINRIDTEDQINISLKKF